MRRSTIALTMLLGVVAGCNFQFPDFALCIDFSKRSPVAIDAEVDKVLTEWQKQRSTSKSFFAKFTRTVVDKAFKTTRTNPGVMRYRHPDLGRLDVLADSKGNGRETYIWNKENELWQVIVSERRVEISDLNNLVDEKDFKLFSFLRSTWFVWLVPTDKTTLQKHGAIRKLKDDGTTVVLAVEVEKPEYRNQNGYEKMVVHLHRPSLLPKKLIIRENADTEVTYDFTQFEENVELDPNDFNPPKLDPAQWKINRQKSSILRPKKKATEETKK